MNRVTEIIFAALLLGAWLYLPAVRVPHGRTSTGLSGEDILAYLGSNPTWHPVWAALPILLAAWGLLAGGRVRTAAWAAGVAAYLTTVGLFVCSDPRERITLAYGFFFWLASVGWTLFVAVRAGWFPPSRPLPIEPEATEIPHAAAIAEPPPAGNEVSSSGIIADAQGTN